MIFTSIFNSFTNFFQWLLGLLPDIPPVPDFIVNNVNACFDFIFSNIQLFELFIPFELVGILFPLAIIIVNLNHVWAILRLIYRLIPIVGKN